MKRFFDSPFAAAAVTLLLYAVFVAAIWNARDRDITRLIVVGRMDVDLSRLPPNIGMLPGHGYDGALYYRLALDPFTRVATDFGITLDVPAYRQQRILYPLVVWVLCGGRAPAVPWMLAIVSVLAMTAIGAAAGAFAQSVDRHAMWALTASLYPGFLYSVSRDLAEPLACAFGLGAIAALQRKRPLLAGALLACAVLTRETFMILVIAAALAWMSKRCDVRVFAIPLAVFAIWQSFLFARWGVFAFTAGPAHLTMPLSEYARVLAESSSLRRLHRLHFSEAALLGIVALLALASWRRSTAHFAVKLAWCLYFAFAIIAPKPVWEEDVGYMRILGDLHITGAATIIAARAWARWPLLVATGVVWYYLATHLVKYA